MPEHRHSLTPLQTQELLIKACNSEGFKWIDSDEWLSAEAAHESLFGSCTAVCPCGHTDKLEPDADSCKCPECGEKSLTSVMRLAGFI